MKQPARGQPGPALVLLALLITCAGFTLALTYAPCYATVCSEDFFGLQTRIHIAIFYSTIAVIGVVLVLRTCSSRIDTATSFVLAKRRLPVFGIYPTLGGILLTFWIITTTVATTALWHAAENDFWRIRTVPLDWEAAKIRLTATSILGHFSDILLGLLALPVSRNSLLARFSGAHEASLLLVHKLVAYLAVGAVAAHGGAYFAFVAIYNANKNNLERKEAFSVHNPFYTLNEAREKGRWYEATLATGVIALVLMLVIVVTALPVVRRRSYNTFYYAHILCSVSIFFTACVHASTNFYFLLPGLLLWILDWTWRVFRGDTGLSREVSATLTNVGGGWYRITIPVCASSTDIDEKESDPEMTEKQISASGPLQVYHLNCPMISKLQNHPFTAAVTRLHTTGPVFLLQKSAIASRRSKERLNKEWTWKLANYVDQTHDVGQAKQITCRVEGPYSPTTTDYQTADQVICVVGGTGLTGAYSLALWWLQHRSLNHDARFVMVWTVRQSSSADFKEWYELEKRMETADNMEVVVHVSSEAGRMDVEKFVREKVAPNEGRSYGRTWVYAAGPASLLETMEDVCVHVKGQMKEEGVDKGLGLAYYLSNYES